MRFLIRDDDTCAMTRPEELEHCYREIWDQMPVGLSVTPFRIPGTMRGVPKALHGSTAPLPLEENRELVCFLRERIHEGKLYVALHGYHHTRPSGLPEYVGGSDLRKKTVHGKRYLEDLLGCRVDTFVPPNNNLGAEGFAAVASAGLNVVNNQPYPRVPGWSPTPRFLVDSAMAARYSLQNRIGRSDPYSIRSFWGFKQAPYQTLGPRTSLDALLRSLRECRERSGVFILATHYHAFGRRMSSGEDVGDGFQQLVHEVQQYGDVEFATYADLW